MRAAFIVVLCLFCSVVFGQQGSPSGSALGAKSTMSVHRQAAESGSRSCTWWETIGDARGAQTAASLQQSATNLASAAQQLQLADIAKAQAQALQQQAINAEMSADLLYGNGQFFTAGWQYGHQAKDAWEECNKMWVKCNNHHEAAKYYYERLQR